MFPQINVLTNSDNENTIGRSFEFDFTNNRFVLTNGKVEETNQTQAICQWIETYIRVQKDKYKIYNEEFGMDFSDLVGYRLPRSYQVSEIIRRMTEGIKKHCPMVSDVNDWNFNKGNFSFTVTTTLGEVINFEL